MQTVVDLSDFAGKEIYMRFRFGSDGNTSGVGWFIDDIELVDLFNFNSEACISSAEGDAACAEAPRKGTIVASQLSPSTAVKDPDASTFAVTVYPNPANSRLTVDIQSEQAQQADISVINAAGQVLNTQRVNIPAGNYSQAVDIRSLPEGFYYVQVKGGNGEAVHKIIIQ